MEFRRHYDEFMGKRGVALGREDSLIWCVRLVRGVLMVMEVCRMKLRRAFIGQEAPMGIEKCISSGAAHPG